MVNLSTQFKAASRSYGRWMALAQTREYIKINLRPATQYKRTIVASWQTKIWNGTKIYGHTFGKLFAAGPSQALLDHVGKTVEGADYAVQSKLWEKVRGMKLPSGDAAFVSCPCCDQLRTRDAMVQTVQEGVMVCTVCVNRGRVRESECMQGIIMGSMAVQCYHTEEDVENDECDYATVEWCRDAGYSRRSGYWYSPEAYNINNRINGGILSYHSGVDLPRIPSAYDKRKPSVVLGMELEVENNYSEDEEVTDNHTIAKSILRKLNGATKGYLKCENDGSLDNGFEMITAPTGLDVHAKTLKLLQETDYIDDLNSHDTDTCGLHVHVCKAGMTVLHAAKLAQFINSDSNRRLVQTIARRYQRGDGYAKIDNRDWVQHMGAVVGPVHREHKKNAKRYKQHSKFNHASWTNESFCYDRYSALNFRNDHTVEFRLFRGTLKYESIMACLEFAYACWFFTREASINELTTEAFMKFITRADNRTDTVFLRAYLKAKKFRAFYQAEQTARPKVKLFKAVPTEREESRMLDNEPSHCLPTPEDQRRAAVYETSRPAPASILTAA